MVTVAYAKDHLKVTFGGTSATTEIWQCGFQLAPQFSSTLTWPPSGFDLTASYLAIKTAFSASMISTGVELRWIKVALVGTDGKYKHDPQDYWGSTGFGNISTTHSGPQDSVVISLWSGSSLGKGNYGRFYLPWSGVTIDKPTGKIVSTLLPTLAAAWVTGLKGVRDSLSTNMAEQLQLTIMGTHGQAKVVTHIKVGDVMDTQRRRRNGLRETYFDANFPPAALVF